MSPVAHPPSRRGSVANAKSAKARARVIGPFPETFAHAMPGILFSRSGHRLDSGQSPAGYGKPQWPLARSDRWPALEATNRIRTAMRFYCVRPRDESRCLVHGGGIRV